MAQPGDKADDKPDKPAATPPSGGGAGAGDGGARGYKRSWKNLLINKQYQLRFTLFMVGLSTLLMAALGWWVMRVASEATSVAIGQERGEPCPPVPDITEPDMKKGDGALDDMPTTPMKLPDDPAGSASGSAAGSGSASGSAAGSGSASGAARPAAGSGSAAGSGADADDDSASRRRRVQIDESSMTITEVLPADYANQVAAHYACELARSGKIADLKAGRAVIFFVLLATGALLIVALAIYGIKTTHKVAGPLYKIQLYFAKMRDGRYDKVWPLRKGDQLVAFYDHFRAAHAGVVKLEEADVERIRAMLDAADAAGLAGKSAEIDAALADLRAILARKEKSLG